MQEREPEIAEKALAFVTRLILGRHLRPAPEEVESVITTHLMPFEKEMLIAIEEKPEAFLSILQEIQRAKRKKLGKSFSRPRLCTQELYNLSHRVLQQFLIRAGETSQSLEFCAWYDFSYAVRVLALAVGQAERCIAYTETDLTRKEAEAFEKVYELSGVNPSLPEKTEDLLTMRQEYVYLGGLLLKDPSGFLLIDTLASEARENPAGHFLTRGLFSPDNPESAQLLSLFVIRGLEFGQKFYKPLYQLSERV